MHLSTFIIGSFILQCIPLYCPMFTSEPAGSYFDFFFFSVLSSSPTLFLFSACLALFLVPSAASVLSFLAPPSLFFGLPAGFFASAFFAVFALGFSFSLSSCSSSSLLLSSSGSSSSSFFFSSVFFFPEDLASGAPFFGSFLLPDAFS